MIKPLGAGDSCTKGFFVEKVGNIYPNRINKKNARN